MSEAVSISSIIAAVADGSRRAILERLTHGACSVGEIAAELPVSRSAVSQHLGVLKAAGLVRESRQGRFAIYALQLQSFDTLATYFDALRQRAVSGTQASEVTRPRARVGEWKSHVAGSDAVDRSVKQWAALYPQLDTSSVALITRLQLIACLAEKVLGRKSAPYGINPVEFRLLGTLRRIGPPHESTLSELARTWVISAPGLVKRVDRLERFGLIVRMRNPMDGRSSILRLTPRGESVVDAITQAHLPHTYSVAFDLPPADLACANGVLQCMLEDLQVQLSQQ